MKTITVTDIYGRTLEVSTEHKKLHDFSNKNKKITYNAKIVEDGKLTDFSTDYIEEGVVTDIEERVKAFGNPFSLMYAQQVGFNQPQNDPDRKIWKEMLEALRENQDQFFTKNGDWKKRIKADSKRLIIVDGDK